MFIPFLPFGSSYKKICPYCFKSDELKRNEAKELMKFPDNGGQYIETYFIHHANNKNGYEIWVRDAKENYCVLNNLTKGQINNFKKNMGLKGINIQEVE